MNKDWKGTPYNEREFYFPRTSREVYGRQLTREDFETDEVTSSHSVHWGDLVVGVGACVIVVYLLIFGWRV